MAEFNPRIQDVSADYTNESRGFTSKGEALGKLFGNAADIVGVGIDAKDKANQMTTEKLLTEGVDKEVNQWLPGSDKVSMDSTPDELKSFGEKIALTRRAYLNGNLTESNFQFKIDSLAKQVRAKYPGYRDVIDSQLSQVLGRNTANQLREELVRQWSREQSTEDEAKNRWETREAQYRKDGKLPIDYDQRAATGKPYSQEETNAYAGSLYRQEANWDAIKKQNDYKKSIRENSQTETFDQYRGLAAEYSTTLVGRAMGAVDVNEFVKNFDQNNSGKLEGDELKQADAAFAVHQAQAVQQFNQWVIKMGYHSDLTKEQVAEGRAILEDQLGTFKDFLYNKDMGALTSLKRQTDITLQQDLATLIDGPDGQPIRKLAVIKEAFGNDVLAQMILSNEKLAGQTQKAISNLVDMNLSMPGAKSAQEEIMKVHDKTDLPPQVVLQTISNARTAILSDKATPETTAHYAKVWFGKDNDGFLNHLGAEDGSRWKAFNILISPRMTEAIAKAGQDDPEILENYTNWISGSFVGLMQQYVDTMRDVNQSSDGIAFGFDPETLTFTVNADPKMLPRVNYNTGVGSVNPIAYVEQWKAGKAGESIRMLNKYTSELKRALDAAGKDGKQVLAQNLVSMGGVFLEAKEGSIFSKIGKFLETDINKIIIYEPDKSKRLQKEGEELLKEGKSATPFTEEGGKQASLRDFIAKAEGADYDTLYGGRKVDLSNLSVGEVAALGERQVRSGSVSSAVGRYQFLSKTLKRAVDEGWISEDEPFTNDLQDRLADFLIESRRDDNPEKFAHNLSQEWAGLPSGAHGQSFYEGVAGNKATVKWQDLLGALGG